MLQELLMVEQRYQAVREVLDGASIKRSLCAMASTAGRFTGGSFGMPPGGSAPWPIEAANPTGARTRSLQRSKLGSCRFDVRIRGGVLARS